MNPSDIAFHFRKVTKLELKSFFLCRFDSLLLCKMNNTFINLVPDKLRVDIFCIDNFWKDLFIFIGKADREEDLPSVDSLSKRPKWPELS